MAFDPHDRDMKRDRGQVLFRYRPDQTFDHSGGFIAQVRQYAHDETHDGPALDHKYLIDQAMRLVRRWRNEGRAAGGGDRAPEFPSDEPLAATHYQIVIPGKVFCRVWPRVVRCARPTCGRVWEARDPRAGDDWPGPCPSCGNAANNRQLQFVFAHQCGELQQMKPPGNCGRGHNAFRLNDQVSRFKDFRWECLTCGISLHLQGFCPNVGGCSWDNKMMSPLLHTAGSAYAGQGLSLVNVLTQAQARVASSRGYVVATLARWLGECTKEDHRRLESVETDAQVPQEVLDSIEAMEAAGLAEQAQALRRRFVPVDLDRLAAAVQKVLGYDPVHDERGHALAASLSTYQRVLKLDRLTLTQLQQQAATPARADLYRTYPAVLRHAGYDPDSTCLLGNFPVTYLAVGYSRAGFSPAEADLVPHRGRLSRGSPMSTLLHAHPTTTEALLFALDPERVRRWLIANNLVSQSDIQNASDLKRWFATRLDPTDGQLPAFPTDIDKTHPDWGARELFALLHTLAHQMLRALAVDSGYSETSLSEYLFPYELAFALHPNGRSEFSIGAMRTVLEQNLDAVVKRAVDNDLCLYDPNCMHANKGADHGCLLLPETACQCWNRHLSRWYLYGSPDGTVTGYWDPNL
ncbi:hypothetical protein J5X84_43695 [Streptosporangiaceae bacterium NEAU-GS5]|nr:hypothetical protein [Streptosporangiaceae bacterium NEAU-GS5]